MTETRAGAAEHRVGSISVVIAVYNAARTLPALVDRLERSLTAIGLPFEAILVNDGSRDESWQIVQDLAARRPWLLGIDLSRNFGQHNALLCGIRAARYAAVVTLDDDLQNPPEEISKLVDRLSTGCDVVYGSPEQEQIGRAHV